MLLSIDFENLHQILHTLYQEMMPLCSNLTGVAKGIAGLGALFYVAAKVWQALARAEPIDVYPLLRPSGWSIAASFPDIACAISGAGSQSLLIITSSYLIIYMYRNPFSPVAFVRRTVQRHHPVGVLFLFRPQVTHRDILVRVILHEIAVFQQPFIALVDNRQPFRIR